jgi:hypothetical protein
VDLHTTLVNKTQKYESSTPNSNKKLTAISSKNYKTNVAVWDLDYV